MPKYKLEPDENLMEYAAKCGVSVQEIWDDPRNTRLREMGNPWLVGSGAEFEIPEGASTRSPALSGKLQEFKREPPPDIIDVYLGFMDEEVNALLAELIKAENDKGEKARPVILVERGELSKDKPILEWRLGNYPVGDKDSPIRKIIHVSPQGMRDATKDEKAPPKEASPKPPPKIPSPPPLSDTIPDSDWARRYTAWKEERDESVLETPSEDIVLYELEVSRAKKRGRGDTLSQAPEEPPPEIKKKAKHGKWIGDFDKWKKEMRDFARKWPEERSQWKKEKQSWDKETESIASEDLLARAMLIYMEQSVGEDEKLKDRGITFRRAFDLVELIQHRGQPKTKSKLPARASGGGPWLSVVRFDVGPDKYDEPDKVRAPIIVMRTPEMGLQPSLMRPYCEFLLKAISLAASQLAEEKAKKLEETDAEPEMVGDEPARDLWEWPLRVYQYGAQGSSNLQKEYRPGKVVHVIASLFVGVDIDREGKTWSLISLCTPAGVYDFLRDEIRGGGTKIDRMGRAQDRAQQIFREDWDKLRLIGDLIFLDPNSPYAKLEEGLFKPGMSLKDAVGVVNEIYKDQVYKSRKFPAIVTLTVSYFGGDDDKKAADEVGIKGVNMEDYHVLRVLRSALCQGISKTTDYPIVLGGRVDRIQCDPKKIEQKVLDAFDEYIKETNPENPLHALMTVEDYADVIVWGLKGLLTTAMPGCVRWKFVDHYWNHEDDDWKRLIKEHLWSFVGQEDYLVPNPFMIEIATDFLQELQEMEPGIVGVTDERIREEVIRLAGAVRNSWNEEERNSEGHETVESRHEELPAEIQEKPYRGPKGLKTRTKAIELISYLKDNCGLNSGEHGGRDRPLLKMWLRPGKWVGAAGKVKAPTTQDLNEAKYKEPKFDGACVDRAFYKSCNMMALQTMAWSVFREG